MEPFANRKDAGRRLGDRLSELLTGKDVVVIGLARGGVPIASEVARILQCPLDVLVVRKIGVPWQPEVAMGAISEGRVLVVERDTKARSGITDEEFDNVVAQERKELDRRVQLYRQGRPIVNLDGRTVVIVDDGIATGATAVAACEVVRAQGAARVIVAAPVTSGAAADRMRREADQFVGLLSVDGPFSVGQWYDDFAQVSDQELMASLHMTGEGRDGAARSSQPPRE